MKRIITLFALIGFLGSLLAAHSEMMVVSPDGKRFVLFVNKVRQSAQPQSKVLVTGVPGGFHQVAAVMNNGQRTFRWENVRLAENTRALFHIVRQGGGAYTLELMSEEPLYRTPPPAPVYEAPRSISQSGCAQPIHPSDFNYALSMVRSTRNPQAQLQAARQVVRDQCPSSHQVSKLMQVLRYEEQKLDFAQFAWAYVYDMENYAIVFDQFRYPSSTMALNEYIDHHPRNRYQGHPGNGRGNAYGHANSPGYQKNQDKHRDRGYDAPYDNRNDDRYDDRYDDRNDDRYDDRYDDRNDDRYDDRRNDSRAYPPQAYPLSDTEFREAVKALSRQNTDAGKLRIGKQIVENNLVTVEQLREMMTKMSFDKNRLELAKFAHQFSYDPQNYYQLYDAFSFSSSARELDEFIR